MNLTRTRTFSGLSILLLAGLTACSSSEQKTTTSAASSTTPTSSTPTSTSGPEAGKSAEQVVKDAQAALTNASSARIKGTVTDKGKPQQFDLRVKGENAAGIFPVDGFALNLIKIGPKVYLKGSEAFWKKSGVGAASRRLADKWVEAPGSEKDYDDLTLKSFADSLGSTDSVLKPGVKSTTLNGKKAVILTQEDGSELYVADASPACPCASSMPARPPRVS